MADKHRGRSQSISRPAFFLLRENQTVNCLGNILFGDIDLGKGGHRGMHSGHDGGHKTVQPTVNNIQTLYLQADNIGRHLPDKWQTRTGGAAKNQNIPGSQKHIDDQHGHAKVLIDLFQAPYKTLKPGIILLVDFMKTDGVHDCN